MTKYHTRTVKNKKTKVVKKVLVAVNKVRAKKAPKRK